MDTNSDYNLEQLDDAIAAKAFRRLVKHLQHRHDAQNIELMGLSRILPELLGRLDNRCRIWERYSGARELIHGMADEEWKSRFQPLPQKLSLRLWLKA